MSESSSLASVREEARRLRGRALFVVVTAGLAAAGCVLLLLTLLPPRTLAAPGALLSLAATGLFITSVVAAAHAGHRVVGRLTPRRLALEAEGAAQLGPGDLLAALELEAGEGRGSAALAYEHVTRVARCVGDRDATQLYPQSSLRWTHRRRIALTSAGLVWSLLGLSALTRPMPTKAAAIALATPWRVVLPTPRPRIVVEPGDARVARGDSLLVRVSAPGRSRVRLVWHVEGEKKSGRRIELGPDGVGSGTIRSIVAPTLYWAEGPDAASDTFAIRPLEPLLVEQLHAVLSYPLYLRRAPDSIGAPLPPLVVPAGTRIELSGRANYSLAEVQLVFRPLGSSLDISERRDSATADPAAPIDLGVEAHHFTGQIQPVVSGEWSWRLRAVEAFGEPVPPEPIEALVIPDSLPRVRVLFPAADTAIDGDAILPLVVEARDDMGLRAVELVSWSGTTTAPGASSRVERVGPERPGDSRALVRPYLDLRDMELLPGDTVYYVLRATDANPAHPAASSDTFRVWLPTLAEMDVVRAEQMRELSSAAEALELAAGDLERAAREEARRLTSPETGEPVPRPASDSPEVGSKASSEQAALQQRSQEVGRELRALGEEIERLHAELRSSLAGDPSLEQKLAELAEQWREGMNGALDAASRELEDRLQANDAAAVRDALDRLAREAQAVRDELQAASGRMEMATLEQSLKAFRSEAEELAARQQAATDALPQEADWSKREEDLAGEAEELAKRLEDLEVRLERSGSFEAADSAGVAGERTARAGEQMREAAALAADEKRGVGEFVEDDDEARPTGDPSSVAEVPPAAESQARSATENLQGAAEALDASRSDLSRGRDDAAVETLARARAEALQLAGEEQSLSRAGPDRTARGRQAALRQGLENLARRLDEARDAGALGDRTIRAHLDAAASAMEAAIERLSEAGRTAVAAQAHRDAIEALNELALRLLETERSSTASSAGAAGQESRERMSTLAQRQGGVTERTRALLPLEADERGVRPQAEQLAREQARIAEELESLGQDEEELLGEPSTLADEARELADRLATGRFDAETVERQRGLFRRMLDAGRSLEQDELDTERRESRTGQAIPSDVPDLDPSVLSGPRFPLPEAAALGRLPPYYRRLVLEYFDRLNAVGAGRDDPAPDRKTGADRRTEGRRGGRE